MAVDLGYQVQTQYPTTEFLGGTQTRDVTAVGITTNGHGVYIEFRIPDNVYSAAQVKDYAIGYTGTIEQVFEWPGVGGASWSQVPTPSGELADQITLTVQSDSGNSAANLVTPLGTLSEQSTAPKVAKLVKALNDAEAGS